MNVIQAKYVIFPVNQKMCKVLRVTKDLAEKTIWSTSILLKLLIG